MIEFRQQLEEIHCDDFKRHMREHHPSQMSLWDALNVDLPRLLDVFEDYVDARYGWRRMADFPEGGEASWAALTRARFRAERELENSL